ncbi:MAG: electron transfer flavoprotein subunit beta/FixA family protein [Flavobacteriales bacterium]|jgi:electron transfer flavoprotein beta subunit|nr:electron transfer flavoprotein subunit beta/FixA family protein [Flavobacteriales bacterium]
MKILVCISSVPDTTSKINFTDNNSKFDTNGIQFVINPYDEFGLTKAVMLKEQLQATVTVITVGDATTEPVIRKALAIGADNAIRVNLKALDSYSTAREIANYIKENPFDLIIAGKESSDYNGGAVPGIISDILEIPFINACNGLSTDGNSAELKREIDGGIETLKINLPIIIGGQKGLVEESELRIPNMRGIMTSRSKPLEVIEPNQTSTLTESVLFEKPVQKGECKIISSDNVRELVNELHNIAKVI